MGVLPCLPLNIHRISKPNMYTGKIPTVCLHRHEEKLVMKRQCYYERMTVTLRHVTPAEPSQANRNSGIAQEACRKLIRILVLQT